jgi:photosystem II stability/assembly factor-like uncharacterized protein
MKLSPIFQLLAIIVAATSAAAAGDASRTTPWPTLQPAVQVPNASATPLLASARAGHRVVAVGDHGVILLSDDGTSFRQAKAVPVRSLLTSVQFIDARRGFAAGHDGVVLGTQDGGETWTLLRSAPGVEQPILSIHFDTHVHGIAVGLYGWAIETHDAGRTWSKLEVESGDNADRHLLHAFASRSRTLFIAGEGGMIFRSADGGRSWESVATPGKGSLWHGLALADGTLVACGMRGHLYRSEDDGRTWTNVESGTTQSLTGIAELGDGRVVVVGLGGTVLESGDRAKTFRATPRAQQEALTAVLGGRSKPVFVSMTGPVPDAAAAKQ